MATTPMLNLPVATSLAGSESIWIVQGGTDKRTTLSEWTNAFSSISVFPFVMASSATGLAGERVLTAQSGVTTITDNGAGSTIVVGIAANGITSSLFRQSTGISVVGNPSSLTADVSDLVGTADQVLRVSSAGSSLAFGAVNLSAAAAVTGNLPYANLAAISTNSVLGNAGSSATSPSSLSATQVRDILSYPSTSVDNTLVRFDGTGGATQGSSIVVDDGGNITSFGGQIGFPATQNPSVDANTLDDYEEGSWTPVLTFAVPGDQNIVYSTQVGRYVKIGKSVLAEFAITTTTFTHTTSSGGINITGVPFTSLNVTGARSRVGCLWQGITKANYTDLAATLAENATTISFAASGSAQNAVAISDADMPTGGNVRFDAALGYIADV